MKIDPRKLPRNPWFYLGALVAVIAIIWMFSKLIGFVLRIGFTAGIVALAVFLIYRSTKSAKELS